MSGDGKGPNGAGGVICGNRRYRSDKYLSREPICSGCPYEIQDLFSGTKGWQTWACYCSAPVGNNNGQVPAKNPTTVIL